MRIAHRLALIKQYNPTKEEIKHTFALSDEDLTYIASYIPLFKHDSTFNPESIGNIFKDKSVVIPITRAIKKPKVKQKPGRKTNKIEVAFNNVPFEPITVTDFMTKYGVSLPVVRQHKRFNKTGNEISVKTINGQMMIWRTK